MENISTYNLELITKYFAGEATSSEILDLSRWTNASVENQKIFEEYKNIWDKVEEDKINFSINIDDEWNKIKFLLSDTILNLFYDVLSIILSILQFAADIVVALDTLAVALETATAALNG